MHELLTPAPEPGEQDGKEGELPLIQGPPPTPTPPGQLFHHVSISPHFPLLPLPHHHSPVPGSNSQLPGTMNIGKQSRKLAGSLLSITPMITYGPGF